MKEIVAPSTRTVSSLGLLRTEIGGKSPLVDALTSQAKSFSTVMLLFPVNKDLFDKVSSGSLKLDEEKLKLARVELFKHVYQTIGSLILAIVNIDNVRKIREGIEHIETVFEKEEVQLTEYEKDCERRGKKFDKTLYNDEKLEKAITLSRELRVRIDILVARLAEAPDRLDLCRELANECKKFEDICKLVHDSSGVDKRKLYDLLPDFGNLGREESNDSFETLINFLGGTGEKDRVFINKFEDLRINGRIADITIRLEPNIRTSTTFNQLMPKDLPYKFSGVGLKIEANDVKEGTYLAQLLESMQQRLTKRFEYEIIERETGATTMMFFPKFDIESLSEITQMKLI
ncbi:MAG: hypothetical protein AABX38_04660 [Candidatus Micrarchaeota archaeon]